jgi:hypothetical protein
LALPNTALMNKIYHQIPNQWKVSKIVLIIRKADKTKIEHYCPVSNLCSSRKMYQKSIMKRIEEIQESQNVDLTGKAQHGSKKTRSTAT